MRSARNCFDKIILIQFIGALHNILDISDMVEQSMLSSKEKHSAIYIENEDIISTSKQRMSSLFLKNAIWRPIL